VNFQSNGIVRGSVGTVCKLKGVPGVKKGRAENHDKMFNIYDACTVMCSGTYNPGKLSAKPMKNESDPGESKCQTLKSIHPMPLKYNVTLGFF